MLLSLFSRRLTSVSILFFIGSFCLFTQAQVIDIDLSLKNYEHFLETIPESFYCEQVKIDADVNSDCQPLCYLIGIQGKTMVSKKDISKALFYLKNTEKFERVIISLDEDDFGHYELSFYLYSYWTLANFSCTGVWFGKEKIKNLYGLEYGRVFKSEKHEQAVSQMREEFYQKGFLSAQIHEEIHRDYTDKTVDVTLNVAKGIRFTVGTISLCVLDDGKESKEKQDLLEAIQLYTFKQLENAWYKQRTLDHIKQEVLAHLNREGYPFAQVSYKNNIDYEESKVNLVLHIQLNKYLKTVINGNRFFSQQQLQEHMMRGSENLWPISEQVCVHEIKELYQQKGFLDVEVTHENQVDLWVFSIAEGHRYHLNDVEFEGVENFSTQRLRKVFSPYLKRPYSEEAVNDAMDALLSVYLEQGFWDIQILKKKFICFDDRQLRLKLFIKEGNRRQLMSIEIPEFPDLESKGPFARFKTVALPVPFKFSYLKEQRKWLLHHFKQHGFKSIVIKPELHESQDGIHLEWHVQLKDQKTLFGKTVVIGSSGVNVEHIYRELCYSQSDLWSKKKLEQTFARLKDVGIYETVSIYPLSHVDPSGEQPVAIRVIADDPYEIKVRFGFQNVSKNFIFRDRATYKIGGTFIYKDVTGNADQIRIEGDFTRFYRISEASYSVPWTFGYPIKTTVKGYCNKFDQPVYIGSKRTLYRGRNNGALISWQQKRMDRYSALNLGLEHIKIDQLSDRLAQAIDFLPALINKWVPYLNLEPTLFIESLNDKLYPSKGFTTLVSCKWMLPLAHKAEYFFKVMVDQSTFFPISRAVFGMRVRAGHIFTKNFCEIVPPERFYLGGPNSIRCYLPDLAPPLGKLKMNDSECCFPQGGGTMVNINFEMRIPVIHSMAAVVFNDLGILSKPINPDPAATSFQGCCGCDESQNWYPQILGAVGIGFRYNTPIGPLRFDFGWNINQRCDCDSPYAWYIALGHTF